LTYREYIPKAPLSDFIGSMYYVNGDMGFGEKKILPDFKTDLLFLFDTRLSGEGGIAGSGSTGFVSGFRRQPLQFRYNGHVEMLGVRFLPYGFTQLFGIRQQEISRLLEAGDVLHSRRYEEILERLFLQPEPGAKFGIVEAWLLKAFLGTTIEQSLPVRAIHRIAATKGIMPVREICNHSQSEYKQLQRFCHKELDMAPKTYARMVRFEQLHHRIQSGGSTDWMSLVAGFEFTDQSHLIREIRQFTGLPPGAFLKNIDTFI
jgi:AraC-like DNA-binding protein